MDKQELKIGGWLQEAFNLYKANFVLLFVTSLLALLLGKLTFGILMGPLAAGMAMIMLRLIDNSEQRPEIGDVFKGFEFFLDSFLLVLASAAVMLIAMVLSLLVFNSFIAGLLMIVVAVVIHVLVMLALCLIVDKRMDFWPAAQAAFQALKSAFLPLVLAVLVTIIASSIGGLVCGIGILVTAPMYWCMMVLIYRDMLRNAPAA
ncbi:MAG: hypothetical protein ABR497_10535 [Kiritimatiellia bacterium]|nr:hypothetical protein [Lentisphaerota bacterium]